MHVSRRQPCRQECRKAHLEAVHLRCPAPLASACAQVLAHFPNVAAHCASLGVDITKVRRPLPSLLPCLKVL